MVRITEDMLDYPQKSIYELVAEARCEAIKEGIKANAIVINKNLVKVPEMFPHYPMMICGLKNYLTSNELPEDYLFAVLHDSRPMTNADRFRAMSDEEQQKCVRQFWEIEDFADWLKQPAEDNQ